MERTTFQDPQVGKALEALVAVRYAYETEHGKSVAKKYGVHGFPTMLVINDAGETVDEVSGRAPKAFIAELDRIGRGENTLMSLRAKVKANADDVEACSALASKVVHRSPAEARKLASHALELMDPADADGTDAAAGQRAKLQILIADTWVSQRKTEEAFDLVSKLVKECAGTDQFDSVAFTACQLSYSHKDLPASVRLLESCLGSADKSSMDVRNSLMMLHQRSVESYAQAIGERAMEEKDAGMLNLVAWQCFERRMLSKEATEWAKKAVELSERAPHVLDTLAELLARSGKFDEAIALEDEALKKADNERLRQTLELARARFVAERDCRASWVKEGAKDAPPADDKAESGE